MKETIAIGVFILLFFGGLLGALIWSGQDFANRCERAGGVNIKYQICVPRGTTILMVN